MFYSVHIALIVTYVYLRRRLVHYAACVACDNLPNYLAASPVVFAMLFPSVHRQIFSSRDGGFWMKIEWMTFIKTVHKMSSHALSIMWEIFELDPKWKTIHTVSMCPTCTYDTYYGNCRKITSDKCAIASCINTDKADWKDAIFDVRHIECH